MTLASTRPAATAERGFAPSLTASEFRALFRGHPGGVAVVTADAGAGPVALTATSVSSVSADPPLLVFSVSAQSSAAATIAAARSVVVHLLDADDLDLAVRCATSGVDRFADAEWTRLPGGEPVFTGARAWVRCVVIDRLDAGGSTVIAAHAVESGTNRDAPAGALVYHDRAWHRLGTDSVLRR